MSKIQMISVSLYRFRIFHLQENATSFIECKKQGWYRQTRKKYYNRNIHIENVLLVIRQTEDISNLYSKNTKIYRWKMQHRKVEDISNLYSKTVGYGHRILHLWQIGREAELLR